MKSAMSHESSVPRRFIEARVDERTRRTSPEQVQETCSFARAERLLRREYHGRFLIELLQNGADAWRRIGNGQRSAVTVVVTDEPALLVANRGEQFPHQAIIESLGHIGRSTKAQGEAIGHKGIGFKSVLEVSLTPELYSGLQGASPVSVRFDPRIALERIRGASPNWDDHLRDIDDIDDPTQAVPVLRYPAWVDAVPDEVIRLQSEGFDTVVRLPFDDDLRPDPSLDREQWLGLIRRAIEGLTDEIIILLNTFDCVTVDDLSAERRVVVAPDWRTTTDLGGNTTREEVTVTRNGVPSSRWRLYRRARAQGPRLDDELAVGLRVGIAGGEIVSSTAEGASAPFHLFFPTRIASGTPFLLHGYFEVDAARTGFFEGSAKANDGILDGLVDLTVEAVEDMAQTSPAALWPLANLLGECGTPDDPRARRFQARLSAQLDDVAWVPVDRDAAPPRLAAPSRLIVDSDSHLLRSLARAFPPDYVLGRTGRSLPTRRVGPAGLDYLASRQEAGGDGLWTAIGELLRPGQEGPWGAGHEDSGFLGLLDLVDSLRGIDPGRADQVIDELRGDPAACLVPVVDEARGRRLIAVGERAEPGGRQAGTVVMARVREMAEQTPIPPDWMGLGFLEDGLFVSEAHLDRAKSLGVRPFTVDSVLDRLRSVDEPESAAGSLLRFLWTLLLRERRSEFSMASGATRAERIDPPAWFWCNPGDGEVEGADRDRQARRRQLARVRVPAADGSWRPAEELAFSADWADWIAGGALGPLSEPEEVRMRAYRALSRVAPDPGSLLAAPDVVVAAMPGRALADPEDAAAQNRARHTLLLRLGVWEVLPVEAFESRAAQGRDPFPFKGALHRERLAQIEQKGGWQFSQYAWAGGQHMSVWVSEDFRFRWPLEECAARATDETTDLLALGTPLYALVSNLSAFCPQCSTAGSWHTKRYRSSIDDGFPSLVALALQRSAWVSATLNGEAVPEPLPPSEAWWSERTPTGAALAQSPLRHLPLCGRNPEPTPELRRLAGIEDVEGASLDRLAALLRRLRREHDEDMATDAARALGSTGQSLAGLHRLAYERLAQIAAADAEPVHALLGEVGVYCDLGESFGYVAVDEARHDDGRFAARRRYLNGQVPFVVIPRDRPRVAHELGIEALEVVQKRRRNSAEREVTDHVSEFLAERVPEFLAIVAHHALGAETLQVGSQQFSTRAERLRRLRVVQVDDLVLDLTVPGTDVRVTIGENSDHDLLLESYPSSSLPPVLFHDFRGDDWKERLRRRLGPYIAAVLENPAYGATFSLFLQADTEGEREEALHELGIAPAQVDAIRRAVGAVSEEARRQRRLWFWAILATLGSTQTGYRDDDVAIEGALCAAGLRREVAQRVVACGGGADVRRDTEPGSALWELEEAHVHLERLDHELRAKEPSDGLSIAVADKRLRTWVRQHGRLAAAALSVAGQGDDDAKAASDDWVPTADLRFALDPEPSQWLAPVIGTFGAAGLHASATALADEPKEELARIAQTSARELEQRAQLLYSDEERAQIMRAQAARWREEVVLLATLAGTHPGAPRAAIVAQQDRADGLAPVSPALPSDLHGCLEALFPSHPDVARELSTAIRDNIGGSPDRQDILQLATANGLECGHLEHVLHAVEAPRRRGAEAISQCRRALQQDAIAPSVPAELRPPTPPSGRPEPPVATVPTVRVSPSSDARKRALGAEGENWALASVLDPLIALSPRARREAVEELVELLSRFDGEPVERARNHAEPACDPTLDEDELVYELAEFLHVARHSDGFGFDMLGWFPVSEGGAPAAMCLEVKSAAGGSFHLSQGEWECAKRLGGRYAVLVVQRSSTAATPARMDLLVNPAALVERGTVSQTPDGFEIAYRAT